MCIKTWSKCEQNLFKVHLTLQFFPLHNIPWYLPLVLLTVYVVWLQRARWCQRCLWYASTSEYPPMLHDWWDQLSEHGFTGSKVKFRWAHMFTHLTGDWHAHPCKSYLIIWASWWTIYFSLSFFLLRLVKCQDSQSNDLKNSELLLFLNQYFFTLSKGLWAKNLFLVYFPTK